MASLTIRPGSHIRLKGQSEQIPDFLVVRCEGDQCWIRQRDWSPETQLNIKVTQIAIPDSRALPDLQRVVGLSELPAQRAFTRQSPPRQRKLSDRKLPDRKLPDRKLPDRKLPDRKLPDRKLPDNVISLDQYRQRKQQGR